MRSSPATSGVDVIAYNNNFNSNLDPDASGFYLFGDGAINHSNCSDTLNATIDGEYSATVIAGPRPADTPLMAPFSPLSYLALFVEAVSGTVKGGGSLSFDADTSRLDASSSAGSISTNGSDSQSRTVDWDANVTILSGVDVLLIINQNGQVVTDEGVTVTDGVGGPR